MRSFSLNSALSDGFCISKSLFEIDIVCCRRTHTHTHRVIFSSTALLFSLVLRCSFSMSKLSLPFSFSFHFDLSAVVLQCSQISLLFSNRSLRWKPSRLPPFCSCFTCLPANINLWLPSIFSECIYCRVKTFKFHDFTSFFGVLNIWRITWYLITAPWKWKMNCRFLDLYTFMN